MLRTVLVAIASFGVSSDLRADLLRKFEVGPWQVGAYSFDGTKHFSHCAAWAPYKSGVTMFFFVSRDYQWSIAFHHDLLGLDRSTSIKLALSLDGEPPTVVTGYAVSRDMVRIDLAPTAELFNKFRRGGVLTVTGNTSRTFNLTDTSKVLPALVRCVNEALNPTPMQTDQLVAGARPGTAAVARAQDNRAEATAIVANLLSQAGVRGFRISPARQDDISADVAWTAENVSGLLMIVEDNPKLQAPSDTAAPLIAAAAADCKGTFFSGALPDEADGAQHSRVFANCKTAKGMRTVYFVTISRKRGGYYVFGTASEGVETPAKEADASIRSVVHKVLPQ